MYSTDNQIAEFRSSVYKDGFGFDVSVFSNSDNSVTVQSDGLLDNTYENFETFLADLADKNPLWHTYYFVRIDKKYQHIVQTKLQKTIEKVFDNLSRSILSTKDNWHFDNEPMNDFIKDIIQQTINNVYHFEFLGKNENNVCDFDETEEEFNDEGFKENGTKEFLQTLTNSQLVSMYKVTLKDNPNKLKFLNWLETELENRKSK